MQITRWTIRLLVLSLIISTTMSIATFGEGTVYGTTLYKDVGSGHWAYGVILRLSENGLINGYPDGSFLPSKEVAYGEFLKMAILSSGKKDPVKGIKKAKGIHWAMPYYEEGLTSGYYTKNRIGSCKLSYPITRGDMAIILSEMLGDWSVDDYEATQKSISDVDYRNPDEYKIVKIYDAGILTGYPDGTFRPNETLNRAEAAAVIRRFMDANRKNYSSIPEPPQDTELSLIKDLIPSHTEDYLLKDVKYYWITDNDPYTYEKVYSLSGIETLKILPEGAARVVLFILGDKIIYTSRVLETRYWVRGAKAGSLLPDFDYIGVYPRGSNTMMLIPSPFR